MFLLFTYIYIYIYTCSYIYIYIYILYIYIYRYIYRNKRVRIQKSYKCQLVVLKKGADKKHCFQSYPLLAWKLSLSIVGIKDHRLHHNLKISRKINKSQRFKIEDKESFKRRCNNRCCRDRQRRAKLLYVLKRNQGQNRQACTKMFHIFHALLAEKKHVVKLKTTDENVKNMMKYSKSKETLKIEYQSSFGCILSVI